MPVRLERYEHDGPRADGNSRAKYWLHPMSGLLILGVDWLFFGPEAMSGAVASVVTVPLAFVITLAGVFVVQRKRNFDSFGTALLKALFGGIVAGIPTSIAGTIVGTLVLVLSGLSRGNRK